MKLNVHYIDRIVRILLGSCLLAFFVLGSSDAKVFGLIGIIPMLTGIVGFCPLYSLLGVDGCRCHKA